MLRSGSSPLPRPSTGSGRRPTSSGRQPPAGSGLTRYMWNKLKRPLQAVLLLTLVGLCIWAIVPIQKKIHLGLDLQGGARVLLELSPTKDVPQITTEVQNQVELVIQNRVNGLGVSEPVISKVGTNRLLVEVPAVKNTDELGRLLKEAAVLDFKICPQAVRDRAEADKKYAAD